MFLAALELPAAERPAFLQGACGQDEALKQEVESLLAFHDEEEKEGDSAPETPRAGTSPAQGAREQFAPGDVFAGRFRMITRIGRGGMGDVWRADDLVLRTPVALKLIQSASADARVHFLNEVRLARRVTHPAVCRVYDFGESGGLTFLSMEFVQGEDLATVLRRVGRLPSEKVVEIAHQLCAGLAAAHAQGVLHRDLKPANVLVDDTGLVRITDFGIAISRGDAPPHTLAGTPGYMAPEQLTPGAALTERTDAYALGLILYELVVGQHPFDGRPSRSDPPRPSARVPDVDPQLERVILEALSPDPGKRPSSASSMAAKLPRARSLAGGSRMRPRIALLAIAAGLAALAVASPFMLPRDARSLTEQDTIVLADVQNNTGDSVFDGTLKVALAVALEQSPFLRVLPDERVQDTLRLMRRSPDERVTRSIAREIAEREGLKALLAGSIGSLGSHYVLTLEAVNAETGDVMAREQAEVSSKEAVLSALGDATARLREELGESLASVQRFQVPLARATTPSLEALHAYSLALDEGRIVPRVEALPHLRRAIEIDPNFALAQALLSGVYANTGRMSDAPAFAQKAFELRDRVSERERYFISWRYYHDATQAWDQALDLTRSWAATYPRESFAFNSLALSEAAFGGLEQAVTAYREAIRLEPKFSAPYGNAAGTLIALNRFDEAKAILQQAHENEVDSVSIRRIAYLVTFVDNDAAGMARELNAALAATEGVRAMPWGGEGARVSGTDPAGPQNVSAGGGISPSGRFEGFCGPVDHGGCRSTRPRRVVSRRAKRSPRGSRAQSRQFHVGASQPCVRALRRRNRDVPSERRAGETVSGSHARAPSADSRRARGVGRAPRRGGPGARVARARSAVRSGARSFTLAGLHSRFGAPCGERRRRRRPPIPDCRRSSWRGSELAHFRPGASRPRSRAGAERREGSGQGGVREVSLALARRGSRAANAQRSAQRTGPPSVVHSVRSNRCRRCHPPHQARPLSRTRIFFRQGTCLRAATG